MRAIAGKAILFLDTCHANQAVAARGVARAARSTSTAGQRIRRDRERRRVLRLVAGARPRRNPPAWGHGAFTKALIEGLGEGKADLLHKGTITVSELDAFIAERVKELTDGEQHPVMSRPTPCRTSHSRS